jgi:hypothetical protein
MRSNNAPLDDGSHVFRHRTYQHYYPPEGVQNVIRTIRSRTGYHLIEAAAGMGKTALIRYLCTTLRDTSFVAQYLFSRDYGHTNIPTAVEALRQQLLSTTLTSSSSIVENLPLKDVINYVATKKSPVLILIDGLDECNTEERVFLQNLLPDGLLPDVTLVITTRPSANEILLKYLPVRHALRDVSPMQLTPFKHQDIYMLLSTRFLVRDEQEHIAHRILDLSEGHPFVVHELCQSVVDAMQPGTDPCTILRELPRLSTIEAVWERSLQDMQQRCEAAQRPLLTRLLAMFAAARSDLTLEEIPKLFGFDSTTLSFFLKELDRYFFKQDARKISLFDKRFSNYIAEHDEYQLAVKQAEERFSYWVYFYMKQINLQDVPPYVLRHAGEYLAHTPDLPLLFARPDWFAELERRTQMRAECKDAVQRAWSAVEQAVTPETLHIQAVNLVVCAIMITSFTNTLLPELVLETVSQGLQTAEWAQMYANLYILPDDRDTVLTGLTDLAHRPGIPADLDAREASKQLQAIKDLELPALRSAAFDEWLNSWEKRWANAGDIENLLEALERGSSEINTIDQTNITETSLSFQSLLNQIQQYALPPTGGMSPDYAQLLSRLAESWIHLPGHTGPYYLSPILRLIARGSQAHLLEALEILVPALCIIFPKEIIEKTCTAIRTITEGSTSSSSTTQHLQVFLCHSSVDKPTVRNLYNRLQAEGVEPWLDEVTLLPGQNWRAEIKKRIRTTDVVLVCLSLQALNQAGYVHKEMKLALDVADEQPPKSIFVIPVRLEECDIPDHLDHLHWVNLFDEDGYTRLVKALRQRAEQLGKAIPPARGS